MAGAELIGKEELKEIEDLFSKSKTILYRYGPGNYKTKDFENEFADYFGVKYAHAVSSGTAAIHCALASAGVQPGDEVITTAWTFVAPVEAIVNLGAIPVLANIDDSYHMDLKEVENLITDNTKAIVSVPMWAAPNMEKLVDISDKNNITLIEDAAQSLGASFRNKKLGTFGKIGSFSFDFGKTLNTGEGGMIITNDKESYDKAAEFSDHGHMHVSGLPRGKDPRRTPGLNYRISELTSAVGLAQLRKIDYILEQSKKNKKLIKDSIGEIKNLEFRKFDDETGSQGDTLIFSVKNSESALKFEKILNEHGFGTKILPEAIDWHYAGIWTHILPRYSIYKNTDLNQLFKKTGELLKRSICINIPILMTAEEIRNLINAIKDASVEI